MVYELARISRQVIVMTSLMQRTLESFHAISPHQLRIIPHGVPQRALQRKQGTPAQVQHMGRSIIMTNGLIHGLKGIEYMIDAMPEVLERHPEALYLINGKPHPGGWDSREYYDKLRARVAALVRGGVLQPGDVVFEDDFTPMDELLLKLDSAAVYVNPYSDESQSVSGTLALAMSTGAAVVTTPYPYARELTADGAGFLVSFRDSTSLAAAVSRLLDCPGRIQKLNVAAWQRMQNMTWRAVAEAHLDLVVGAAVVS